MDYSILINLIIKVAILVALGYLIKKTGMLNAELEKGVSNLLVNVVCPLSIIASGNNDFSMEMVHNMILMAVISCLYYLITILIMRVVVRRIDLDERSRSIFITMAVFANTAFIGYPISQELYGNEGFVYAVIYNFMYSSYFFTYGISVISGDKQFNWKKILITPLNGALLIMLVLFLFQIKLPYVVQDTFSSVGNMMVPLSMIIIGASLVGMKPAEILKDKASYMVSFFRLIVFPLAVLLILLILGIRGKMLVISVVMSSLPSGSLNVIFAKQYDCEADFAARAVVQSMLFCVITIPCMLFISTCFA